MSSQQARSNKKKKNNWRAKKYRTFRDLQTLLSKLKVYDPYGINKWVSGIIKQ